MVGAAEVGIPVYGRFAARSFPGTTVFQKIDGSMSPPAVSMAIRVTAFSCCCLVGTEPRGFGMKVIIMLILYFSKYFLMKFALIQSRSKIIISKKSRISGSLRIWIGSARTSDIKTVSDYKVRKRSQGTASALLSGT